MYLKQAMFLRYIVLQLFCIYNLCYMLCYFVREICFVFLHQHFPQFVCSAQYGCFFLLFLNFVLNYMMLRYCYCLRDFEMVPVAPIIAGITFAFTFHMRLISVMRPLYFNIFPASFLITFLSPTITTLLTFIIIIIIIMQR